MTLLTASPQIPTIADLLERLGGIAPDRVRFYPLPGTATEADVIAIDAHEDRVCELIDGVLVEKPMGIRESFVAVVIASILRQFVVPRNLGMVTGESGTMRILPGLVRIPDVAYTSVQRLPGGHVPDEPIPALVPDLAVEVLSKSNTQAEMARKLGEDFSAGVRLVWLVDLNTRSVSVYSDPARCVAFTIEQQLDGGDVLPGFTLPVRDIFAELDV